MNSKTAEQKFARLLAVLTYIEHPAHHERRVLIFYCATEGVSFVDIDDFRRNRHTFGAHLRRPPQPRRCVPLMMNIGCDKEKAAPNGTRLIAKFKF